MSVCVVVCLLLQATQRGEKGQKGAVGVGIPGDVGLNWLFCRFM